MAYTTEKAMAQAAVAEKDAVAYIDCIFHRRYAEHLPLSLVLQDMTHLRNRNVLSFVGAMPFCQKAFLQTRTHLYRIYNEEIYICPKDYRDALANLVDYVISRPRTTLADLYAYCSAAHPTVIKGEIGTGLTVFRRFVEEHPTIFELIEPAPKELDNQEVINYARVYAGVLLFPKIKIAVGRVVNISGNSAYLECHGEFVLFHAVNANLPATAQLKNYITKGDMVPFEARSYPDPSTTINGSGSASVVLAAAGVRSAKLRNVWRAISVELPRNTSPRRITSNATTIVTTTTMGAVESTSTSPRSPQLSPFESPVKRASSASSNRDSLSTNSYMAPLDDATEWAAPSGSPHRRSSSGQKRDSAISSSTALVTPTSSVRRTGSAVGTSSITRNQAPHFPSTNLSRTFNPFLVDASTQAGTGRPNLDKEVQTEVTDEELMLRLIRKYPNLLNDAK